MDINQVLMLVGAALAALPLFLASKWTQHWWGALVAAPVQLLGLWLLTGRGVPSDPASQPGLVLYAAALAWLAQIIPGVLPLKWLYRLVSVLVVAGVGFAISDGNVLVTAIAAVTGAGWALGLGRAHGLFTILALGVLLLAGPPVLVGWGGIESVVLPALLVVAPVGIMAIFSGIRGADWWKHGWAWPWILPLLASVLRLALFTYEPEPYVIWSTVLWAAAAVVWAAATFMPLPLRWLGFVFVLIVGVAAFVVTLVGMGAVEEASPASMYGLLNEAVTETTEALRPEASLL